MHTETADFLGGLRPVRQHSQVNIFIYSLLPLSPYSSVDEDCLTLDLSG